MTAFSKAPQLASVSLLPIIRTFANVAGITVGVKDISLENIHFLNNSDDVIVAVKTARAAITEEEGTEEAGEGVSEGSSEGSSEGGDDKPAES